MVINHGPCVSVCLFSRPCLSRLFSSVGWVYPRGAWRLGGVLSVSSSVLRLSVLVVLSCVVARLAVCLFRRLALVDYTHVDTGVSSRSCHNVMVDVARVVVVFVLLVLRSFRYEVWLLVPSLVASFVAGLVVPSSVFRVRVICTQVR